MTSKAAASAPKCVFLNTYYDGFLAAHYRANPGLESASYAEQKASLQAAFFGDSDFYSRGLEAAGWRAEDLIVNCAPLQKAWAGERGSRAQGEALILEQIRALSPDVAYFQDLNLATRPFLEALRPHTSLIAGQIASPIPGQAHLPGLDLIISSFPHFVDDFRRQGITAYYQPLAFEARVWERVRDARRDHAVTFVGGISPAHAAGTRFLEQLAGQVRMDFWGYGKDSLPADSPIRRSHHGESWGEGMFRLLAGSRITVNRHIDTARNNANNMRLFEATGCGALLITDYKDNLHELFDIGREVVAYRSPEECAALIRYYLEHPAEAEAIAQAGQRRTLSDHAYGKRMAQTAEWLARHLRYRRERGNFAAPDYSRISYGKTGIRKGEVTSGLTDAWKDSSIPKRQRALTQEELGKMYAGAAVTPYQALAESLAPFARPGMGVLEIGCSTGYYSEVLEYLLKKPIAYAGVDYSGPMIEMAKDYYPGKDFRVADGASLPFADASFPVVVSSCVLLHVPDYPAHIRETARVASGHVVAHRTPVCRRRPTQYLRKFGYGVEMVELLFNEEELLGLFRAEGLELIRAFEVGKEETEDCFTMNYVFVKRPTASMERRYCTLFDRNYLTRGVALARSLAAQESEPYRLYAVCLDELSRAVLDRLALPGVATIGLHEIEAGDSPLLASRADRSLVEYYFTLTPSIIRWVMANRDGTGPVTYLDSDLFFFSPPEPVFEEMGEASILIHGHRFTPELEHLAVDNGIYNVGLVSFRDDARGRAALEWWRARCLEWCKAIPENGKMGDQKYLDDWPERFPGTRILEHAGAGLAPWNLAKYHLGPGNPPAVDGLPVVFFHFHALAMPTRDVLVPVKHPHYALTPESLALMYVPYAAALRSAIAEVTADFPSFDFGFREKDALQAGCVILARPEIAIGGAENIPKASLPDGWICFLTPQLRAQPQLAAPARLPRVPAVPASGTDPDAAPSPSYDIAPATAGTAVGNARAWNDLAVEAHRQGDLAGALRHITEALKADPKSRPTLLTLARIGLQGPAYEPARDLLLAYLDGHPDDWEMRAPLIAAEAAEFDRMIAEGEESRTGWKDREYEITVLVSTYKSEAFIEEALTDLEAQTIADRIEIIVVDANSPQNERAVVERFQGRYGNIRYLRTRERIGIYPAWNLAARMARGRFLTPMSTNDRLAPDAYEALLQALRENPGAGLSYGDTHLTTEPHQTFHRFAPTADYGGIFAWPPYDYDDLLINCRVGPHPLWRRDLHNEIGWFDGRYKAIGDQDYWLRIALKYPLLHIPRITGLAWITKDSLSGDNSSLAEIIEIHCKHSRAYLERERAKMAVTPLRPTADWSPAARPGSVFLPAKYSVAAVVSSCGSGRNLRGCLEDLASQTLYMRKDMEIVVVDGGSGQGVRAIVEEFQRSHERIVFIGSDTETAYAAWNRAALASRSRFLVNANTDDRHRHDAFEIMARELDGAGTDDAGPGLAYCDALLTKVENETFARHSADRVWALPDWNVRQGLIDCPFGCTVMWRRSAHASLGLFDEGFRFAGDYEFFFRVGLQLGARHIRKALTLHLESPATLSHEQANGKEAEVLRFLGPYRRELPLDRIYPFLAGNTNPAAEAAAAVDFASWLLEPSTGRKAAADSFARLHRAYELAGPKVEILCDMIVAGLLTGNRETAKASLAFLFTHEPAFAAVFQNSLKPESLAPRRLPHPGLAALPPVVPSGDTRVRLELYRGELTGVGAESRG